MIAPLLACALLLQSDVVSGGSPDSQSQRDLLRGLYAEDARSLVFRGESDVESYFELVDTPVMQWDTDDDWSGDVFVWTADGRPQVVGSILTGPRDPDRRTLFREFHLLAEEPIVVADLFPTHTWAPKGGLVRHPLPGAPAGARTAAGRLVQMRNMARQFTVHMQAEGEWELRYLPQPIFRYGDDQDHVIDGAIFAYVWDKGTDPELLLLLECRRDSSGELSWIYAPVRFSTRALWLKRDGRELWRVEAHQEPRETVNTLPYATDFARVISVPGPALEEDAGAETP